MIFRFTYEFIAGIITIASIILFGPKGQAALLIVAPLPIIMRIMKIKPDERELQLFYKSGNLSLGLFMLALIITASLGLDEFFIKNWFSIIASALLITHGLAGLIIFRIN